MRADARRNRQRLLEVARQVFATEGMAVQIDELARRAGVGVGTVYRHFPTKEALFEAIVLDRIARLTEGAREAAAAGDPGAAFFEFFGCMIETGAVNKALFESLAQGVVDRDAISAVSRDLHEVLGDLLTRAQRAGAVRTDIEVSDLKALISGALAMERQAGGTPGRMVAIVCDGLRPPSPDRVTPSG